MVFHSKASLINDLLMSPIRCPVLGYCPAHSCPCGQTATTQNPWAIQCERRYTHAKCATHGERGPVKSALCGFFSLKKPSANLKNALALLNIS